MKRILAALVFGLMLAWAGAAVAQGGADTERASAAATPVAIAVTVRPFEHFDWLQPEMSTFGALTFLGGLELESPMADFGGWSGLVTLDQGRSLISASDSGRWLRATLVSDAQGRLTGLTQATMASMVDASGRVLPNSWSSDAEGLTRRGGGRAGELVVSFEGAARVLAFPLGSEIGRGRVIWTPGRDQARLVRGNSGLEGVASAPPDTPLAGHLLMLTEKGPTDQADHVGFIVGPRPGSFSLARRDNFDVTDLAFLPNGDLLVLERRFNWAQGVGMRILRVRAAEIVRGARLVGETLIEASLRQQIDNMEGLAVDQLADGRTILTLISDDNHSILQRTLVLRFALTE